MPKAKKTISKKRPVNSNLRTSKVARKNSPRRSVKNEMSLSGVGSRNNVQPQTNAKSYGKFVLLAFLFLILAVILMRNKGLLVAAMVNGHPITRLALNNQLMSRYGSSLLEELINDELIKNAAEKKGIKISQEEINSEITRIQSSLGGKTNLDQALAAQGMTLNDLKVDIERRLLVNKIIAGSVNVSDKEVNDYIDKNRATMTATDDASLKSEALNSLTQQKKAQATQKWFNDLKAKAKVSKYI